MAITAAMVKELRESTGAGMMDAKKALEETSGDMEAAVDWLRTKGLAKAAKKSGRVAAEGLVAVAVVLVVGIADDMWDLRWWVKMAGQVLAGLAVALGGIRIEAMPVGWIPVGNETTQVILTVFAVVLTMNAINFVDGLDGLAAGVALIGGSAFFVYSYLLTRTINQFDYANLATLLMALLVGACVGFLP